MIKLIDVTDFIDSKATFGEDGSVVVTKIASNGWTLTTVHDLYNGYHPVSGNRELEFTAKTDGSYTFIR